MVGQNKGVDVSRGSDLKKAALNREAFQYFQTAI